MIYMCYMIHDTRELDAKMKFAKEILVQIGTVFFGDIMKQEGKK